MQFGGGGLMRAGPLWPLRGRAGPAKQREKGGKTRVLILMSDTGGGHRASAEALKASFQIQFGARLLRCPHAARLLRPLPFASSARTFSRSNPYPQNSRLSSRARAARPARRRQRV